MSNRTRTWLVLLGTGFLLATRAGQAPASTVIPMDVTRLADEAGQVIVGRVAATRSYWAEEPRRIETEVEFREVTYAKNPMADSPTQFTIIVPGGTVGTWSMRVCGGPIFKAGERWLLFLLPEYRTFPVVGVSQGAFRIVEDVDGVSRVLDNNGRAVLGLDATRFVRTEPPGELEVMRRDTETQRPAASAGVRVLKPGPREAEVRAISLDAFVAELQPVLDASQRHEMSAPAGRRVSVAYRAVPLGAAGEGANAPQRSRSTSDRSLAVESVPAARGAKGGRR